MSRYLITGPLLLACAAPLRLRFVSYDCSELWPRSALCNPPPNQCPSQVSVMVEKDSQRPVMLGRNGAAIKQLSTNSRIAIEEFLGAHPALLHLGEGSPMHVHRCGFQHEQSMLRQTLLPL